jgi:hypothetical protein
MTTKDTITTPLEPDMLLKCSRCGRWHEVKPEADATGSAVGQLFWRCGKAKFYAGNVGGMARRPFRRREFQ